MKVTVILEVEPEDADSGDGTGLTSPAYGRLTDAIRMAGFEIHNLFAGEVE